MLRAFIDDSGSGGDSPWYVLAGYIGTVEGWDSFDSRWREVLYQDPRIEYFKSSEAESLRPQGQWAGVTKDQRNAKIDCLIAVIGHCARRAICARMRQRDYDDFVKGRLPSAWDSPYFFLFAIVMGASINIERLDGISRPIDFVFDDDEKHEGGVRKLSPGLALLPSFYGSLFNVSRQNDRDFLPLQAADLLAWQIRRAFSVTNESRRRHFDAARRSPPEEPHDFIVTRVIMKEMMDDLLCKAAELSASLAQLRNDEVTS